MRFLRKELAIIVLAVVILLSGCAGETTTSVNNPGNTMGKPDASNSETAAPIVFAAPSKAGQDFRNNIYIMEASGEDLRQLTNSDNIGLIKYSPDAGEILYSVHYDAAAFHWHIMDVDKQNQRQLTEEPTISNYRLLPGDGLVYEETVSNSERENYLKIKNIKTGSEKKVPAAPLFCGMYSVTPGGEEIWCLGNKPGEIKNMLLYKKLDDEEWNIAFQEVPLPNNAIRIEEWSPDGNYLVFWYYEDDQNFLALAERSNGGVHIEFIDRVYQGKSPLWNEEGNRLAFYNREGIWTAKPNGEPQLLLACEGVTELLQWQGKVIVFAIQDRGKVTVAKTSGGEKEVLAQLTVSS